MSNERKYMTDENGKRYHLELVKVDHATTDWGQVTLYNDHPKYWCSIVNMIGEEIHAGYPGYTDEERKVIDKFLNGVVESCNIELGIVDPVNKVGPHPNRKR
jgi:hypothetical protein